MSIRPIILVSPGRCGTTLLQESLRQHQDINIRAYEPLCYDARGYEYYHDYIRNHLKIDPDRYKTMTTSHNSKEFFTLVQSDYLDFVLTQENVTKILYGQMARPVVDWIQKQDALVVHMVRYNLLDCLISHANIWYSFEGIPNESLYLEEKRCVQCIYTWLRMERHCDMWFKDSIKIFYEDLLTRWDHWIPKILEGAGHKVVPIPQKFKEQKRPRRLDQIENPEIIEVLQEHFGRCMINRDNLL